jgi:hypothetical protein
MNLIAMLIFPFALLSLLMPVLIIILIVKLVRCCVSGRVRLLPIAILCVVAWAIFSSHDRHGSAVAVQQSSQQVNAADTQNDLSIEGDKLKVAIKNYSNDLVGAQIDKANQMLIAQSGTGVAEVESTLCATTADADNEAYNAATELLLPHVKAAMEPRLAGSPLLRSVATDEWMKDQIKSSVSRGVGITNRHVDRIDRPYGTLWKETLDVDTSARAIESNFAAPYQQLADAQAEGRRNEWVSLAGLIGVIFLLYSFLNSATKGYFVWRLRAVATLVLIAAVLAIFALV